MRRVLIATIRDKGRCPCPRCQVTFDCIALLGEDSDRVLRAEQRHRTEDVQETIRAARNLIYKDGYVVNSDRVDALLQSTSLVPTLVSASSCRDKEV